MLSPILILFVAFVFPRLSPLQVLYFSPSLPPAPQTPDYMSPEMVLGEPYSYEVDFWAFGVLIFEMLMGMFSAMCLPGK